MNKVISVYVFIVVLFFLGYALFGDRDSRNSGYYNVGRNIGKALLWPAKIWDIL
jgi:hypothetical protein